MKMAVTLKEDSSLAHFWLAKAYEIAGMKPDAAREAKIAAVLDPQNIEYSYYYSVCAQNIGDFGGSLEALEKIKKIQRSGGHVSTTH